MGNADSTYDISNNKDAKKLFDDINNYNGSSIDDAKALVNKHLNKLRSKFGQARDGYTTAIDLANKQGKFDISKVILQKNLQCSPRHSYLNYFIFSKNFDMLQYMFDNFTDLDVNGKGDEFGYTPIFITSSFDKSDFEFSKKVIDLLVKNGADVNCKDRRGRTPLKEAIDNNNNDLAKVLIGHGARIN